MLKGEGKAQWQLKRERDRKRVRRKRATHIHCIDVSLAAVSPFFSFSLLLFEICKQFDAN